jgi:membrane protease subunit (stomatin/prohibitin family)
MRDPDFGSVRVRAFGTYTLKASDPRVLLKELVGTDSQFEADEISELLRSMISTAFADVVAKSKIGLLDLASNYQDLSEEVRRVVMERIDDEYGLEIPQLYIVNISVPAEVEQALDTRSSMSVIGDMATFQSYQLGQAMPAAAENPAGGLAGAGVGLGMGMAMAGPMMQGAGVPPAPQTPPPPPAPAAWHLAENGQTSGPYTLEQIGQAIAAGRIRPETMVWTAGMAGWAGAAQTPQLAGLFQPAPPPGPTE